MQALGTQQLAAANIKAVLREQLLLSYNCSICMRRAQLLTVFDFNRVVPIHTPIASKTAVVKLKMDNKKLKRQHSIKGTYYRQILLTDWWS